MSFCALGDNVSQGLPFINGDNIQLLEVSQNVEIKGIHLDRRTFTVMLRVIEKLLILKLLEYDGQLLIEIFRIQNMK